MTVAARPVEKQVKTMRKLLVALPLILAVACTAGAPTATGPSGGGGSVGRDAAGPVEAAKGEAPAAVPAPAPGAPNAGIPTVIVNPNRSLILTAKIDMRAQDPWATSDRAQLIATSLGGDVVGLSQSGTGDSRAAFLTIRVPSTQFSEAIRQLKELQGEVVTSSVSSQDVTDQFVDLEARLKAKQAEEQRYLAILARANTIDEILKVDASLANVRVQIEQLTAQINSIKSRTEFSTIAMSISTLAVLPGNATPTVWDPVKTFGRALAALGAMMQVFADFAIWMLVFGWLPLLGFAALLVVTRARRPDRVTPPAPTA